MPKSQSIVSRIAGHAAANPDRIAIIDEASQVSFGELDRRSSLLAAQLQSAGARPETCVGLFLDRSVEFVVAALAVFKAGAAYLPLDPTTPAERVIAILMDAEATLLITHRAKTCGWSLARPTIDMDCDPGPVAEFATMDLSPESLAYVVYTSGSSGQPKGVEITHANLLNLVDWHQAAFHVTEADRASQVAGLGFDATAWEIWPHVTAGASLHIAGETTRRSPHALRDWLVTEKITISFVPTVLAEQLMNTSWPCGTALRTFLTGADVLNRRPVDGLPFVVVNNYGPSECTVVATSGIVCASSAIDGRPSIGAPIHNTVAYILDHDLRPVPTGDAGELCLAGALVGRGYRNCPDLTAARFVMYLLPSGEGVRIYRTGDRVRQLSNGELEFLGRLDEQIKIRGYRIEPGEIIARLNAFPGVEASAVIASNTSESLALVAYVVPAWDAQLNANDLREFLARRLPDYMIPQYFCKMTELPLTSNGKLEKSSLPAPTTENQLSDDSDLDSVGDECDSVQDRVAALVTSLLKVPSVEPDDNFFMIGGHSMLGVQLVARIRDMFGVTITLRQLFAAPTVAALSSEVERRVGVMNV